MISFSDHIRQAVGTSATDTKSDTLPERQGFLLVADPMGSPSGTPIHSKVYKSIPTSAKYRLWPSKKIAQLQIHLLNAII